jgi:hypothetical protein
MQNDISPFLADVIAERRRQVEAEGFTAEHDDQHQFGELALAGAAYAAHTSERGKQGDIFVSRIDTMLRAGWFNLSMLLWPFERHWWKPKDRYRDLVKAAAFLVAEGDRLNRLAGRDAPVKADFAAELAKHDITLPLKLSDEDTGVIIDSAGRDIVTVDVNGERDDIQVTLIAAWIAEAVNAYGGFAAAPARLDVGTRIQDKEGMTGTITAPHAEVIVLSSGDGNHG